MAECAGNLSLHDQQVVDAQKAAIEKLQRRKDQIRRQLENVQNSEANNGFMPYVFLPFRWSLKEVNDQYFMAREFLAIFELQAGAYPYWFADSEGITLVCAFPNQKNVDDRKRARVVSGMSELSESDAQIALKNIAEKIAGSPLKLDESSALTLLYDQGYKVFKPVDQKEGSAQK